MSETSLAVWDVPMPVVAGEMFAIKVGVKSATGRVEVRDSSGAVVASGTLLETVCPGTEALYWTTLDVPAPAQPDVAKFTVRCAGAETWFSVAATAKPEYRLLVQVSEQDSKAMLDGVEIRLGPFHARTGKDGRAELLVGKGDYQLHLWRTAHIAQPRPVTISGDASLALTMVHVPEEHPDARWVR
jgi:hypothetical protein